MKNFLMQLQTFASCEWEGLHGYWLRVELWRDDNGFTTERIQQHVCSTSSG